MEGLPPRVQREVRRILASEARRLLGEHDDVHAVIATAGPYFCHPDDCADQGALRVTGESIPAEPSRPVQAAKAA